MSKIGYKQTKEHKSKLSLQNHWNWQGGKKVLQDQKLYHNQKSKEWKDRNPEKVKHKRSLYHERMRNVVGTYTLGEWETLKAQYGFTCPSCGKSEPEIELTRDHIIPISKGGSNYIENIQPLCKSCNCSKSAKLIEKFDLIFEDKVF